MNASFSDLAGEHRTEPVPPEPNRLVADIDPPLEQEILDPSQRKRIADVHHHREADHLGPTVEVMEGILHPRRLRNASPRLKPICSDNAQSRPNPLCDQSQPGRAVKDPLSQAGERGENRRQAIQRERRRGFLRVAEADLFFGVVRLAAAGRRLS